MAEWASDPSGRSGSRPAAPGGVPYRPQMPPVPSPYDYAGGAAPPSMYSDGSAWQHEYPPADYRYAADGGWNDRRRMPGPAADRGHPHPHPHHLPPYPYPPPEHYGAPPGPAMMQGAGGYYGQAPWGAPGTAPPMPNDSRHAQAGRPAAPVQMNRLGLPHHPQMHDAQTVQLQRPADSHGYPGAPQPTRHPTPAASFPSGAAPAGAPPSYPAAGYHYSSTPAKEGWPDYDSGDSDGEGSPAATSDGFQSADEDRSQRKAGKSAGPSPNGEQHYRDGFDEGQDQGRTRKPKSKEANRRAVRQYRMRKKQAVKDLSAEHNALTERVSFLTALVKQLEAGVQPLTPEERKELDELRVMKNTLASVLGIDLDELQNQAGRDGKDNHNSNRPGSDSNPQQQPNEPPNQENEDKAPANNGDSADGNHSKRPRNN